MGVVQRWSLGLWLRVVGGVGVQECWWVWFKATLAGGGWFGADLGEGLRRGVGS